MIYELRTYTVKPGTLGDMVKAASTVSRDIRGDNFGKLEGYWLTEIGPLNQVLHMWSYNSFEERARLRAELSRNPRWTGEYIPLIRPLLLRQNVRLMNAVRAPVAPGSTGNVYELRNYRGKPAGGLKQWLDAFTAVLPAREKHSKIVGLWTTEAGEPTKIVLSGNENALTPMARLGWAANEIAAELSMPSQGSLCWPAFRGTQSINVLSNGPSFCKPSRMLTRAGFSRT